jgi:hypothetical protein
MEAELVVKELVVWLVQLSVVLVPRKLISHIEIILKGFNWLRQNLLFWLLNSLAMVAVLPSDLATEAQSLRRELEIDRLFSQAGAGSLSAILRHSGKFCRRVKDKYKK